MSETEQKARSKRDLMNQIVSVDNLGLGRVIDLIYDNSTGTGNKCTGVMVFLFDNEATVIIERIEIKKL